MEVRIMNVLLLHPKVVIKYLRERHRTQQKMPHYWGN
jgi:hypothetical protein